MNDHAAETSYDRIAYPGRAFYQTHPSHLEIQAVLRGLDPAPADRCRVLEIGCGHGENLVPMAMALPGSQFVGVDLSGMAISRAKALAGALDVANVTFIQQDLTTYDGDGQPFDYIIAHGVYSWVPPFVREALLALMGRHLAPHGVAFVSYNCRPRASMRQMARDLMRYHTRNVATPEEKVAKARSIVVLTSRAAKEANEKSIYAAALADVAEDLADKAGEVLFHDDLSEPMEAFLFHEVAEAAAAHGLRYMCETRSPMTELPVGSARDFLASLPEDDIIAQEQYRDFIHGRGFRDSAFCRAEAPFSAKPVRDRVRRCVVSGEILRAPGLDGIRGPGMAEFETEDGLSLKTDHLLSKAALWHLGAIYPTFVAFPDLVDAAMNLLGEAGEPLKAELDDHAGALAGLLLRASTVGVVSILARAPPVSTSVPERPRVSALARYQATQGDLVTSLSHMTADVSDPKLKALVALLDGTRTDEDLVRDLPAAAGSATPVTLEDVRRHLRALARIGLFEP